MIIITLFECVLVALSIRYSFHRSIHGKEEILHFAKHQCPICQYLFSCPFFIFLFLPYCILDYFCGWLVLLQLYLGSSTRYILRCKFHTARDLLVSVNPSNSDARFLIVYYTVMNSSIFLGCWLQAHHPRPAHMVQGPRQFNLIWEKACNETMTLSSVQFIRVFGKCCRRSSSSLLLGVYCRGAGGRQVDKHNRHFLYGTLDRQTQLAGTA